MIAVDTSALMAVVLGESEAARCKDVLRQEPELLISAGTMAEVLIVAAGRNVQAEMRNVLDGLGFTIVPVTDGTARRVGEIWQTWGRGRHRAALNFGDCFAYDTAKSHDCPLLYVGNDFRLTDLRSALSL